MYVKKFDRGGLRFFDDWKVLVQSKTLRITLKGFNMDITGIDYLGIDRVLKRGTGEIIENHANALLVRDNVSGAYFLACEDETLGISLLDRYIDQNCNLLMVSNECLGRFAFEKYRFSDKLECFQVAYYGKIPVVSSDISVRVAGTQDLSLLIQAYGLVSPEEMRKIVERGNLLLGYYQNQLIGFIGEHLEGSMGLLHIFPEFRRKGFATALEKIYIATTIERGFIPFGQVEKDNYKSLNLQKKIGMTQSENLIWWMWK